MKYVKKTLTLLLFAAITMSVAAQTKYSKVQIVPPQDKQQRAELLGLLEIDHFNMYEGKIIAEISQQQMTQLRQTNYQYEILVDDVAADLHAINQRYFSASPTARAAMEQPGGTVGSLIPTPSAFQVQSSLGGFYSFTQMNTAMNTLVANYSSIAQKISLGVSVQGRDIWCIKISDNVGTDETNEPEVLFMGLQHAREAIGGSSLIFLMQYLCENYASDSRVQALVNNREIFIIPCMNPDGWEYNRVNDPNGGGGWRKNRRNNGDGTFGVDLNRNWSFDWANCSGASSSCGSSTTSSDVYWGPSAFSEPETQAVRNFVISHHLISMIDQHAFGPYYSLPFGRPSLHPGIDSLTIMDQDYYDHIPASMGKYNGMRAGNSIQSVGYEVAGGVKDWMLKAEIGVGTKGKIYGMTGEGGAGDGTGGPYGSFWPPASEIVNLCKGMVYQDIQMIFASGPYVDITDQSDIALTAPTGSLNFRIKRIGIADGQVTVTLLPLENISSVGSQVVVNSLPNYFDTYNGNISYTLPAGIQAGHRIKYAWRVQVGGQTYYDTLVKFYNPVQLFYDDMEGASVATNWVVSSGWNYTNTMSYAGTKSLTESPAGLYGQNRNDIIRYNGTFNLSDATAAYVTFRVKHRAENFRDKLELQVSPNGSSWTSIAGTSTVQEPGTTDGSTINGIPAMTGIQEDWIPVVYNLSAYLGQGSLQMRFVFSSDANTTGYDFQVDEGFNVDNLKVIKSTTALMILPVHFTSFTGRIKEDNTAELNWAIAADSDPEYFSVEKSVNGTTFWEAGRTNGQVFNFIDHDLFAGNNYYRIKAMGSDRTTTYTNVINLVYKPKMFVVRVYPNPAKDEVNLRITGSVTGNVSIRITDLTGRVIYNEPAIIVSSPTELKINSSWWAPGFYYLQVTDDKNTILTSEKILKQ